MRFHIGVSFRWKTIKKFLIPIILGILAYLGFGGIFDHFNIPLGFIQVNALENYDTSYTINYTEYSIFNTKIDDNVTYNELFSNLNNIDSEHFNLFIDVAFNTDSSIKHFRFTLFPKYMPLNFALYGNGSSLKYGLTYRITGTTWNSYSYLFTDFFSSDIYSDSLYLDFYTCFTTNVCNNYTTRFNLNGSWLSANYNYFGTLDSQTSNDINNTFTGFYTSSYDNRYYYFVYSSQSNLYIDNGFSSGTSTRFYKTLIINGNTYNIGDYFYTYYDYLKSLEPVEPDNPSEEVTEHKLLFNKVYWFDDKNTTYGVLTSIYELLFLYCLTMILLKIGTLLKNKRW